MAVKSIVIEAPASIANLGPGFDVLAMAIEGLSDRVSIEVSPGSNRVDVYAHGFAVPSGEHNVAYAVAKKFIELYGVEGIDIRIEVYKGIPVAAGLGSSGATSIAVAYGLSKLFNLELDTKSLLKLASVGEAYVAGSPHYDNIAASLLGGVVIVDPQNLEVYSIRPSVEIWIGVVVPETRVVECKTRIAREVLPKNIDLKTHVKQCSSLAKLIHALHIGDVRLLGEAISQDYVVEPHRAKLIESYWNLKKIALENGAHGFNIAGAGPSVFLVHSDMDRVEEICRKLIRFLEKRGVNATYYITRVSSAGVRVVKMLVE